MDWRRDGKDWPMAAHSRFVVCPPHKWHVQEAGTGPLLLLIHGAGGATQSWRHLFGILARQYHVVAMDLPGQGFTKPGTPNRFGLDAMATDLLALCVQEGWQPDALIGHSAGGAIALRMAELIPPAPPVIGINAALGNFTGLAGVMFPLIAKTLAMAPGIARLLTASIARPASVERLIRETGSVLDPSDLTFYRRLIGDRAHINGTLQMMAAWTLTPLLERLPQMDTPCLLLAGDQDKTVPPEISKKVAARMPNARYDALPGLGHLAHEEAPETVAQSIASFLEEIGQSERPATDDSTAV